MQRIYKERKPRRRRQQTNAAATVLAGPPPGTDADTSAAEETLRAIDAVLADN